MKSNIVAGILGITLGYFGAHKFYNGEIGMGVLYLVFSCTGIPGIIGLIEGIMYLVNPDAYNRKYNGGVTPPLP